MAFSTEQLTLPNLRANSTGLATSQFLAVKVASTAGQCVLNATSVFAGNVVGILQNNPAANEEALVAVFGVTKAIAATSTIAVGDSVGLNTTGRVTDNGTTDNGAIIGKALIAAAAAGDIISILLKPGGDRYQEVMQ